MAAIALVLAALAAPLASASAAAADVETPMLRRGLKFGYGTGEAEVVPTSYAWSGQGESCRDACASIGASCSDSTYYECGDDCANTGVANTCDFSWVADNYPLDILAGDSPCYSRFDDTFCPGYKVAAYIGTTASEWMISYPGEPFSCDATCAAQPNYYQFCACV